MKTGKRTITVLISVIVVLLCIVSVLAYRLWLQKDWIEPTGLEKTILTQIGESVSTQIVELDYAYAEKIAAAKSNADAADINYEFSQKWENLADAYYQDILGVADELEQEHDADIFGITGGNLETVFLTSQDAWKAYAQIRINEQNAYLDANYAGGSIVSVLLSEFQCNLYRERAVELYNMYLNLNDLTDLPAMQ